jgi:hypothetical protein
MVISWQASQGASSYVVERSLDTSTWSAIATGVTSTSFVDPGLNYSTVYYYRILAVSSSGAAASSTISAVTSAQPDVLTGQPLTMDVTRGVSFTGPIAIFEDANTTTTAGRFTATINWGNGHSTVGKISGSDGTFTITGTQLFSQLGIHVIKVSVRMTEPDWANVVATSTADVTTRSSHRPSIRARRVARLEKERARAAKKTDR